MRALDAIGHALAVAGTMTWEITWSLILGFTLSAIVQALIRRETITRLLGDDRPRTLALATGLGAASSSCSYAAVALARALFRKGASFTSAMVFEIASTNLVIELGVILALLISWQFTLAEFIGGPIMIVLVAVAFRLFVRGRLIEAAREQASKGLPGSMEGHAAMDMSIAAAGSLRRRHLGQPHLRDGMGGRHPRHRHRPADRGRRGRLGAGRLLAAPVPDRAPARRPAVGTRDRAGDIPAQLRLLDRQRAAGRGAVERRDRRRRRGGVHLRRPDHHPDPGHLPEVLRHPDDAHDPRDLLRRHGAGRLCHRVPVRRPRAGARAPGGEGRRGGGQLELHHRPQHRLPAARRGAAGALLPLRRRPRAQDDDRQPGRPRAARARRRRGSRARRRRASCVRGSALRVDAVPGGYLLRLRDDVPISWGTGPRSPGGRAGTWRWPGRAPPPSPPRA